MLSSIDVLRNGAAVLTALLFVFGTLGLRWYLGQAPDMGYGRMAAEFGRDSTLKEVHGDDGLRVTNLVLY